jgi:hypothetical protein
MGPTRSPANCGSRLSPRRKPTPHARDIADAVRHGEVQQESSLLPSKRAAQNNHLCQQRASSFLFPICLILPSSYH